MPERRPSTTAARRRWVVAGAAIGWIMIVVAGAGSEADDSLLGVDNLDMVWAIFFGLAVVLSLAFMIYLNPFSGEWVQPAKTRRGYGFWILLAVVALLWVWRPSFLQGLEENDALGGLGEVFESDIDLTPEEPAPETVAQASDLLLIAAGLALLGGLWYFLRWRSRQHLDLNPEQMNQTLETDLAQALEDASHELTITGDPRTAVLRSYAVLETVLATHGFSRTKAETPTEHLRRSLQKLPIESGPVVELGKLYEIARFSDHTISPEQQADAGRALDRARTSLAGNP